MPTKHHRCREMNADNGPDADAERWKLLMHLCSVLFCFHERRHCSRFSPAFRLSLFTCPHRQDMKASHLKGWNILPAPTLTASLSLSQSFILSQIRISYCFLFLLLSHLTMNFFSDHQWWQIRSLNATIFMTSFVLQWPPLGHWMAFWLIANTAEIILWQQKRANEKLQNKTGTQMPAGRNRSSHSRLTRAEPSPAREWISRIIFPCANEVNDHYSFANPSITYT